MGKEIVCMKAEMVTSDVWSSPDANVPAADIVTVLLETYFTLKKLLFFRRRLCKSERGI